MVVAPLRPRILLAVAALGLVAFLTFHQRDALADMRSKYLNNPQPATPATRPHVTPQLNLNPHKLPSADSFRAHFEAVTRLPGISMADAMAGCQWPKDEYVNFQFAADDEWVVTPRSDHEIEERRQAWHDYVLNHMIPWADVKDKFAGRGIVVVAGNHDTVMRLKVVLRRLLWLRSKMPVEVHYWDDEMSLDVLRELRDIYPNIAFNDLSNHTTNIVHVVKDSLFINFQLKTAALINTRFAEPLLLDSDNVPVVDPATLYDSTTYREFRTVFWPDIARSWPQSPAWAITNTPCRMDEYELESGQLMVDKRRYWYHLQLAAWLNNEQGAYYNKFLLGDKDMFRYAWHALKTPYGRPRKWLTSVGTLNDGFYCGHSFAQHHPDSSAVAFLHGGLTKIAALEVMRWNRDARGGYYRHYKRAPSDEDPSVSVHVQIIFDGANYKPNHTADFRVAMCTEMRDVPAGDLEDILPGWEPQFEELGGFWKLEQEARVKAEKARLRAEIERDGDFGGLPKPS